MTGISRISCTQQPRFGWAVLRNSPNKVAITIYPEKTPMGLRYQPNRMVRKLSKLSIVDLLTRNPAKTFQDLKRIVTHSRDIAPEKKTAIVSKMNASIRRHPRALQTEIVQASNGTLGVGFIFSA